MMHLSFALLASALFLCYLALFRIVTLGLAIDLDTFGSVLLAEVGDFFLVCLLLYGAVLSAGALWIAGQAETTVDRERPASEALARLEVRSQGRRRYVEVKRIDWVSAEGSYVRLHVGQSSFLLRESLTRLTGRLGPSGFVRIHRSTVVNRARVACLRPVAKGDAELELRDGTVLRMSRRYRAGFEDSEGGSNVPPAT